jgi:hypothetical protein
MRLAIGAGALRCSAFYSVEGRATPKLPSARRIMPADVGILRLEHLDLSG